ncbi:WYL domain-containing protein [Vagococcus sp. PNs007]|uniref:WYL domain-containing protein n=1 Tax=Vagococcus proximus TaxID=2991417 RepID=A0ABT5X0P3_9ENTE|nr:WYL domain-containing protein [Vagococcus proximus]MDF0479573.1 WYL domain-containing protein [Vagococcus proximus]
MYTQLLQRKVIHKQKMSELFGVNTRTIQRDLATLKDFLTLHSPDSMLLYKRSLNGYILESNTVLNKEYLLVLTKILLESRSLTKSELLTIINQLSTNLDSSDKKELYRLYGNELNHYIGPKHEKPLAHFIWNLTEKITDNQEIKLLYKRSDKQVNTYYLIPQSIIFSDFYFYLTAYNINKKQVNTYRVDRILAIENYKNQATNTTIKVEDSEFRKHAHLMQVDKLVTVTVEFSGTLEALLDKFPHHSLLENSPGELPQIEITAYQKGLEMWLFSQRDLVKILGPESFKTDYLAILNCMLSYYK